MVMESAVSVPATTMLFERPLPVSVLALRLTLPPTARVRVALILRLPLLLPEARLTLAATAFAVSTVMAKFGITTLSVARGMRLAAGAVQDQRAAANHVPALNAVQVCAYAAALMQESTMRVTREARALMEC